MAFVANITGNHHHHDGNRSSGGERDHEEHERGNHSRGLTNLLAMCAAALLAPPFVAGLLVVRARRKQAQGEVIPQDDSPPDGYEMEPED